MQKLLSLRPWLSLEEAAAEASNTTGDHITTSTLLQHACAGNLHICLYVPTLTQAKARRGGRFGTEWLAMTTGEAICHNLPPHHEACSSYHPRRMPPPYDPLMDETQWDVRVPYGALSGGEVYDFPMIRNNQRHLEQLVLEKLGDTKPRIDFGQDYFFLVRGEECFCPVEPWHAAAWGNWSEEVKDHLRRQERYSLLGEHAEELGSEKDQLMETSQSHPELSYWPARELPAHSKLVVRPDALQAFISTVREGASTETVKSTRPASETTVIDTLHKLLFGMAVDKYGYEPWNDAPPPGASITRRLGELGIEITDNTVIKHLREAFKKNGTNMSDLKAKADKLKPLKLG